jgi:hypothetical protein
MNALKKIFLLSLLSVLLLSAFSQNSGGTELLQKISLSKYINPAEFKDETLELRGIYGFFYREVTTQPTSGGVIVTCTGWGWKTCFPARVENFFRQVQGMDMQMVANSCEELVLTSEEQILRGEYSGVASQKIAFVDPQTGRPFYILIQIRWNHDPLHLYNGEAEITISKSNNLGL